MQGSKHEKSFNISSNYIVSNQSTNIIYDVRFFMLKLALQNINLTYQQKQAA